MHYISLTYFFDPAHFKPRRRHMYVQMYLRTLINATRQIASRSVLANRQFANAAILAKLVSVFVVAWSILAVPAACGKCAVSVPGLITIVVDIHSNVSICKHATRKQSFKAVLA